MKSIKKKKRQMGTITEMNSLKVFAAIIFLSVFASCSRDYSKPGREYMPNMYRVASYKTYEPNPNFKDSLGARPVIEGTVPRGYFVYEAQNTPEAYEASLKRKEFPSRYREISEKDFEEGKRQYTIYCAVCHGEKGDGNGILVEKEKFAGVPSYASASRPGLTPVSIYHVITYGKGVMGSHAAQVLPDDRWKVVHYVLHLREELDKNN
ncbi:c-type cytochrome [Schleiferia thermophila]|nr:cytochrome c [Schleiferia thermophila]